MAPSPAFARALEGDFQGEVELFFPLTQALPFAGGAVSLAGHPSEPRLFVSVQELGKVFAISTEDAKVVSELDVPDSEEGPKAVAFDEANDALALLIDDRLTRWREGPSWAEVGQGQELPEASDECECLSVDGRGRALLDLTPPAWLLPNGSLEPLPLEPLPDEPPKAVDGDLEAVYRRQSWEATTVDLSSALLAACSDGGVFFYARDSRSAHYLAPGELRPVELSARQARMSRGVVVHMESDVPEDGRSCMSPAGGMFVVGPGADEADDEEGSFYLWSFALGRPPAVTLLTGFRHPPAQLDAVAADAQGRVYISVVERWPDRRAIYRASPVMGTG